jgi:hypothetical protein
MDPPYRVGTYRRKTLIASAHTAATVLTPAVLDAESAQEGS